MQTIKLHSARIALATIIVLIVGILMVIAVLAMVMLQPDWIVIIVRRIPLPFTMIPLY